MRACAARCERLLMPLSNAAPQSNYLDALAAAAGRDDKRARLIDSEDYFSQYLLLQ
jgi:hypothetical protein